MSMKPQLLADLIEDMQANNVAPSNTSHIRGTGNWERFHVQGEKKGSKNGTVLIKGGKYPSAVYRSWAQEGAYVHWHSQAEKQLSPSQRKAVERDRVRMMKRAEAKQKVHYASIRKKVVALWNGCAKVKSDHAYLTAKGIDGYCAREDEGALVVPYRDFEGKLNTVQRIVHVGGTKKRPKFVKRWFTGGAVSGHFCQLGDEPRWQVVLAEGFADAASIHEAIGLTTVDVGGGENLKRIAKEYRNRYPMLDIIIAGNNDEAKALREGKTNYGIERARAAALAVGGRVAIPTFGKRKPSTRRTDFNDLARVEGLKAVRAAIRSAEVVVPDGGYELRSIDAREFVRMKIPMRKLLVAPWLPERGLVLIHGMREVGKTHFEIGLLAALVTSTDFLAWKVKRPVSALLVDGEMPQADLQRRILGAIQATGAKQIAPWRILTPDMQPQGGPELSNPSWRDAIERHAAGCEVIVLDSVSTLLRVSESMNDAASWAPIQDWMVKMKRKGHSIVWMHHDGKGGDQLGTVTRETVLDTSMQLRRTRPTKYGITFRISYSKLRGAYGAARAPMNVTFETMPSGRQKWSWNRAAAGAAQVKPAKYDEVKSLHQDGKLPGVIAKATGVPESTVRRWIKEGFKLHK